jgi:hypothetical protein
MAHTSNGANHSNGHLQTNGVVHKSPATPERRVYKLMGPIGVGKSILCNSAESQAAVFDEFISTPLLDKYIGNPNKYAFSLQMAMLQSAFVRSRDAARTLAAAAAYSRGPVSVVVERPAQENVIFERANHRCKNINDEDHGLYNRAFDHMMDTFAVSKNNNNNTSKSGVDLSLVTTIAAQLWTPEHSAIRNMIERNRLSEDGYEDKYLNMLAHCYFLCFLEVLARNKAMTVSEFCNESEVEHLQENLSLSASWPPPSVTELKEVHKRTMRLSPMQSMLEFAPAKMRIYTPVVIDWSQFGTWTDFLDKLTEERLNWTYKNQVTIMVHDDGIYDTLGFFHDASNNHTISVTLNDNVTHADLSWYMKSINNHQKQCSAFRDLFFKARAHMHRVIFHMRKCDFAPFVENLTFYTTAS